MPQSRYRSFLGAYRITHTLGILIFSCFLQSSSSQRVLSSTFFGGPGDDSIRAVSFVGNTLIVGGQSTSSRPIYPGIPWTTLVPQVGFLVFMDWDAINLISGTTLDPVQSFEVDTDSSIYVRAANRVLKLNSNATQILWATSTLGTASKNLKLIAGTSATLPNPADALVIVDRFLYRLSGLNGAQVWKVDIGKVRPKGLAVGRIVGSNTDKIFVGGDDDAFLNLPGCPPPCRWRSPFIYIYDTNGALLKVLYDWSGNEVTPPSFNLMANTWIDNIFYSSTKGQFWVSGGADFYSPYGALDINSVLSSAASSLSISNSAAFSSSCYPTPCMQYSKAPITSVFGAMSSDGANLQLASYLVAKNYLTAGTHDAPCDYTLPGFSSPGANYMAGLLLMEDGSVITYGNTTERIAETATAWYFNVTAVYPPVVYGFVSVFKSDLSTLTMSTLIPATTAVYDADYTSGRLVVVGEAPRSPSLTPFDVGWLTTFQGFPADVVLQGTFAGGNIDGFIVVACMTNDTHCQSIRCPPGQYSPFRNATCFPCQNGTYSTISLGKFSCMQCWPGAYSLWNASTCTPCPSGTYSVAVGAGDISYCLDCPAGTWSNPNSTSCTPCAAGLYAPSNGSASCIPCPMGTYSTGNAAVCTNCGTGTANNRTNSTSASFCTSCPLGSYQDTPGQAYCVLCPSGTYNPSTGSNSMAACLNCPIGTYRNAPGGISLATDCWLCPQGTFNNMTGQLQCTLCSIGFYNPLNGSSSISACLGCPSGSYSVQPGATALSACVGCNVGYYAPVFGSTTCSACPSGTYSSKQYAISISTCQNCPGNTYALAGSPNCTLCSINVTYSHPGYSTCISCSADYTTGKVGSTATHLEGYIRNGNFEEAGSIIVGSSSPASWWTPGNLGDYSLDASISKFANMSMLIQDPGLGTKMAFQQISLNIADPIPLVLHGWGKTNIASQGSTRFYGLRMAVTYVNNSTTSVNKAFSANSAWTHFYTVFNPTLAVSSVNISIVLQGYSGKAWFDGIGLLVPPSIGCACKNQSLAGYAPSGGGWYLLNGWNSSAPQSCAYCEVGYTCRGSVRYLCPTGYFSYGGALDCTACPTGRVCTGGVVYQCPNATWIFNNGFCVPCPSGYQCHAGVSSLCPAGYYNSRAGICTQCPAGSVSSSPGATSCQACPGNWTSTYGHANCSRCGADEYSYPGTQPCTALPVLKGVRPSYGGFLGNTTVTIFGQGIGSPAGDVYRVTMGGIPVPTIISSSSSEVVVVTPNATRINITSSTGRPSPVTIAVFSLSKGARFLYGAFTYRERGVIQTVRPAQGPVAGGTLVTIGGRHLSVFNNDVTQVTICGISTGAPVIQYDGALVVTTGDATSVGPSTCPVVVFNAAYGNATLPSGYTYV